MRFDDDVVYQDLLSEEVLRAIQRRRLVATIVHFLLGVAAFLIGIWACGRTGRALGVPDHGGIVWDEIAAFALVLVFTPASWLWTGIAFALFRLFDIVKPWPIRQFDARLKNGFGVMFDDLLAAGYTIAVIKGLTWLV